MRILILAPGDPAFSDFHAENLLGIEHQIWGLARALTRRKHEVYIVRRWHHGTVSSERIEDVSLVNLPDWPFLPRRLQGLVASVAFSMNARDQVKRIKPDGIILTELVTSV